MLDYSINEFVIISSLYFVFHYLFKGIKKKKRLGSSHSNLRLEWEK